MQSFEKVQLSSAWTVTFVQLVLYFTVPPFKIYQSCEKRRIGDGGISTARMIWESSIYVVIQFMD